MEMGGGSKQDGPAAREAPDPSDGLRGRGFEVHCRTDDIIAVTDTLIGLTYDVLLDPARTPTHVILLSPTPATMSTSTNSSNESAEARPLELACFPCDPSLADDDDDGKHDRDHGTLTSPTALTRLCMRLRTSCLASRDAVDTAYTELAAAAEEGTTYTYTYTLVTTPVIIYVRSTCQH